MIVKLAEYVYWPTNGGDVRELFQAHEFSRVLQNTVDYTGIGILCQCSECGEQFEVPDCIFRLRHLEPHFHGSSSVVFDGQIVTLEEIEEKGMIFRGGMVEALRSGFRPHQLFDNKIAG